MAEFGTVAPVGRKGVEQLLAIVTDASDQRVPVHRRSTRCDPLCQDPWLPWLTALLARKPTKVAAIALANKIARMAWALMAKGERYKEPVALAA
jgi:transposase